MEYKFYFAEHFARWINYLAPFNRCLDYGIDNSYSIHILVFLHTMLGFINELKHVNTIVLSSTHPIEVFVLSHSISKLPRYIVSRPITFCVTVAIIN